MENKTYGEQGGFIHVLGTLIILLSSVILLANPAQAQIDSLKKGDRVKLIAPSVSGKALIGNIVMRSPSVTYLFRFRDDSTYHIPNSSIEHLSISRGKKRRTLRGAVIGAASGGLLLGIVAVATNPEPDPCDEDPYFLCGAFEFSDTEAFGIGALVGGVVGAAAGAIIGTFVRADRWERVSLDISMGGMPFYKEEYSLHPIVSFQIPVGRH